MKNLYVIKTEKFGSVLISSDNIQDARKIATEMFPKMNRWVYPYDQEKDVRS